MKLIDLTCLLVIIQEVSHFRSIRFHVLDLETPSGENRDCENKGCLSSIDEQQRLRQTNKDFGSLMFMLV